jgi:hypothetical protein
MDGDTVGRPGHIPIRAAVFGAVMLVVVGGLVAVSWWFGLFGHLDAQEQPIAQPSADLLANLKLFKGWNNPDVVIVLSGEQHGYVQPCGCSSPQYGGLTRRYNFIQHLRQRGWPVVAADLGDVPQKTGQQDKSFLKHIYEQSLLKYTYSMMALKEMDYSAVGIGEYEISLSLSAVLAQFALNNESPRIVSANLKRDAKVGQAFMGLVNDLHVSAPKKGAKVGIFSLTGPSVEKKVKDPDVQFNADSRAVLERTLAKLRADGAELFVLLYQGDADKAKACAEDCQKNPKVGRIDVILCLSEASEPRAVPVTTVGDTMIIEVGYKGRHVGVIGAFRRGGVVPFELKYQLVSIAPEFDTPKGKEKGHAIMELMEQYTTELERDAYLAKYKQMKHTVQVEKPDSYYVGSAECKKCHAAEYKIWEESDHGKKAYQTLLNAKHPSKRQFDGECIVCHTTGFGYQSGFENFKKTADLINVGCESCHGPSSEHVKKTHDAAIHKLINPLKYRGKEPESKAAKTARMNQIGDFCMKCHDTDNDNHFDIDKAWPQIVHILPAATKQAGK